MRVFMKTMTSKKKSESNPTFAPCVHAVDPVVGPSTRAVAAIESAVSVDAGALTVTIIGARGTLVDICKGEGACNVVTKVEGCMHASTPKVALVTIYFVPNNWGSGV